MSSVIEIRSTDTTSARTELQRIDHAVMVQKIVNTTKRMQTSVELQAYSHCIVPKVCIRWEFRLMKSFRMSSSDTDISLMYVKNSNTVESLLCHSAAQVCFESQNRPRSPAVGSITV